MNTCSITRSLVPFAVIIAASIAVVPKECHSEDSSQQVQEAVRLYLDGEWEAAVPVFEDLLKPGRLPQEDRIEALKYLALSHLKLGTATDKEAAVTAFGKLIRESPRIDTDVLKTPQETEISPLALGTFGRALIEVRNADIDMRNAMFSRQSRGAALARSVVLPGWGQRYRGYRNRGHMMLALSAGSAVIYVGFAGRDYRKARDHYEQAPEGSDFEALYRDYTAKADRADLSLGVLGAVWLLNAVDAAIQGPNISEGIILSTAGSGDGLQIACNVRF